MTMLQVFIGPGLGVQGFKSVEHGTFGVMGLHGTAQQDWFLLGTPDLGLPPALMVVLADQFRHASTRALTHFWAGRNDEDTLTGSFGASLADAVKGTDHGYTWSTSAKKLRGRGKGASEKRLGADMAIEIEVDVQGVRRLKTLLVQAKTEWRGTDRRLTRQAQRLSQLPGGGLVLDYGPTAYRAVRASAVVLAGGNARLVPPDEFHDIGDALGRDFLSCMIGSTSIYYSVTTDRLWVADGEVLRDEPCIVGQVTRTTVRALR